MNFSDLSALLKALPRDESKQKVTFIKNRRYAIFLSYLLLYQMRSNIHAHMYNTLFPCFLISKQLFKEQEEENRQK